jgi:hypothetical protein
MEEDYYSDEDIYDDEDNLFEEFDSIDERIIDCIVKMKMYSRDKNDKIFSSRNTFELIKQFYVRNNIQK